MIAAQMLLLTLGPLGLSVAVGLMTSSQPSQVARLLPQGFALGGLTWIALFCTYKWVPQTKVKNRYAATASLITSCLWEAAAYGYSIYTRKAVTTNLIYGSLSAIPTFMLWVNIEWLVILSGALLTAVLQRRNQKSTAQNSHK
jgi:membrane protein